MKTKNLSRRPIVAISLGLLAVGLTGCAGNLSRDTDAATQARLDSNDATIVFPLDAYANTKRAYFTVQHANDILIDRCMRKAGDKFPETQRTYVVSAIDTDRRYGIWTRKQADTVAYELPTDPQLARIDAELDKVPDSWWENYHRCKSTTKTLPLMTTLGDQEHPSVVDRGIIAAQTSAKADRDYQSANDAWAACIAKSGLKPQLPGSFVPALPDNDKEARSRIAVIDVTCKERLRTVQTVANVEAQYQQSYIKQHQSELNAYKNDALKVLSQARSIDSNS